MSDIHLDARREAEEAFPVLSQGGARMLGPKVAKAANDFAEARRVGYTRAAEKYLPQLSALEERNRALTANNDRLAKDNNALNEKAAEQDKVIEGLRKALELMSGDMHQTSLRPCPTCRPITEALGKPFGCYAFQAAHASSLAPTGR